jgi:hypothetical protein
MTKNNPLIYLWTATISYLLLVWIYHNIFWGDQGIFRLTPIPYIFWTVPFLMVLVPILSVYLIIKANDSVYKSILKVALTFIIGSISFVGFLFFFIFSFTGFVVSETKNCNGRSISEINHFKEAHDYYINHGLYLEKIYSNFGGNAKEHDNLKPCFKNIY